MMNTLQLLQKLNRDAEITHWENRFTLNNRPSWFSTLGWQCYVHWCFSTLGLSIMRLRHTHRMGMCFSMTAIGETGSQRRLLMVDMQPRYIRLRYAYSSTRISLHTDLGRLSQCLLLFYCVWYTSLFVFIPSVLPSLQQFHCNLFQFELQVQPFQDLGDDTALNSICLTCSNGKEICSKKGFWGDWGESEECHKGLYGINYQLEEKQGDRDDTAGNELEFFCNCRLSRVSGVTGPGWGRMQEPLYCADGDVICGLGTRVQEKQGEDRDDSALNGFKFLCCSAQESKLFWKIWQKHGEF